MSTSYKLILVLLFSITVNSCKKKSVDQNQFDINLSYEFFKGNINGEYINLDARSSSLIGGSGRIFPADSLDSASVNYRFGLAEYKSITAKRNSFEIVFYKSFHHSALKMEEVTPDSIFRDIFRIGNIPFIKNDTFDQTHESGVLIIWTDIQSVSWSSAINVYNITGNEIKINTDRVFNITHSIYQDPHPQITVDLHKIRATFNCVLYNIERDSIEISNGEFVGIFSNQNE